MLKESVCSDIYGLRVLCVNRMHLLENHERPMNTRSSCPSNDHGVSKGETGRTDKRSPVET